MKYAMRRMFAAVVMAGSVSVASTSAQSATIFADTVIDYLNSGANAAFPTGIYGGDINGAFPVVLADFSNVLDENANTFVSLPEDSFITLGFSTGFIFDGIGNDLFVAETGSASEKADVFISSDFGTTFTLLGMADGGTTTEFDLGSILFAGMVNAVKIVGLDSLGGSPGFDIAFVQGLEGSVSTIPVPAALPLLGTGLAMIGFIGRRRRRKSEAAAA